MEHRQIFTAILTALAIVIIILALTLDKPERAGPVIEETEYVQLQWMLIIDEPEKVEPLVITSKAESEPDEDAIVVRYVNVTAKNREEKPKVINNSFNDYEDFMQQCCEDYGVPFALALAVAEVESGFDPQAVSCTGDYGLMQINEINHEWLWSLGIDPMTVEGNIEAGVYMLWENLVAYGTVERALMAYNCGDAGALELWNRGVTETDYTRKVMEAYGRWKEIYETV